jgi:two-component system chemotaxis sensor kinase CheA
MERDQLIQKLTATFLVELRDHVRNVERDLLALERGPDAAAQAELYASLFRTAHSLKGASRAVGAGLVETACHRLEEIVQAFRDGLLAPDKEVIQLFLATADAIGEAGDRIGARHWRRCCRNCRRRRSAATRLPNTPRRNLSHRPNRRRLPNCRRWRARA